MDSYLFPGIQSVLALVYRHIGMETRFLCWRRVRQSATDRLRQALALGDSTLRPHLRGTKPARYFRKVTLMTRRTLVRIVIATAFLGICLVRPVGGRLILYATALSAQDEPVKDNPSVTRFPGTVIASGREADFDGHDFQISATGAMQHVEGKSWEFMYVMKQGARTPSPLEVTRNYANQFASRGGKVLFQVADGSMATMRMPLGSGERWLSLIINNDGEQILMYIIETAAMKQKVEFSADQMAEQVAATGKVILRGILFDTAKSDIKAESAPVLDEVAAMMKSGAALKFRIDGHTDNVGAKAANLTLSRARAASVKAA